MSIITAVSFEFEFLPLEEQVGAIDALKKKAEHMKAEDERVIEVEYQARRNEVKG